MHEDAARSQIVEIGRRMHAAGMAPGQDGNLSIRLSDTEALITPSRVPKGYLSASQIIKVDLAGNVLDGELSPSVETPMHLAVYRAHSHVKACIHAHPVFTIVLSIAEVNLSTKVLPEIATIFGRDIPVAEYVTPGTPEMGDVLVPLIGNSSVAIQKRHGLFSTGATLHDAWYKAEQIEGCAKILYYASRLGGVPELPDDEVERLLAIHDRMPDTPPEKGE